MAKTPDKREEIVPAAIAAVMPSELPSGVFMHDGDGRPMAIDMLKKSIEAKEAAKPPANWRGAYVSCGVCGGFLGNARTCPDCSPRVVPENVHNAGVVKCL